MKNLDIGIFAQNVNNLMREKDLTNGSLARKAGLPYQKIYRLTSKKTITMDTADMAKICEVFNVDLMRMNHEIIETSEIKKMPKKIDPADELLSQMINKLHQQIKEQKIRVNKGKNGYLISITDKATICLELCTVDDTKMYSLSIEIGEHKEELICEQNHEELRKLGNECEQYIKDTRISEEARMEIKSFLWSNL